MKTKPALWITTTAIFFALLIAVQAVATVLVPAPLTQYVTGPLVNLILILSVMLCGLSSGLTIAVISPILAHFIAIGPPLPIVPFIMLGNTVFVLAWALIGKKTFVNKPFTRIITLITAAVCKFIALYFSVVHIAVPFFLSNHPKASALSAMFSFPQLFTALAGGVLAVILLPALEKIELFGNNN